MENKTLSQAAFVLSLIAVVLAVLDTFSMGVWLSASSWLIVAAVLGIWSLIFKPAKS